MFVWTDDMLRFMRDACEYTHFYDDIAARLAPELPPAAHVLDAGCGAGYLTLALLPYVHRVTAVDVSADAVDILRQNLKARGVSPERAEALTGEVASLPPQTPYDAIVCCFFGGVEEALSLARAQGSPDGRLLLVKKDWRHRRFVTRIETVEHHSTRETCAQLDALGIPYTLARAALEMGQPFRSFADALRFFACYDFTGEPVDAGAVRARLREDPTGQYAYYMPERKNVGLFSLAIRDIPAAV